MRGYLQERIRYKAKKFGIEVSEVNPAHSSRECPPVSLHGQKDRLGDSFKCSQCGYHGHADLVAALNILGRLGNKEIRIGMPPSRVKAVLDGRYVGWKSLNHTVSDKTSGVARVVNESPRSASSKSELRSNVQVLYSFQITVITVADITKLSIDDTRFLAELEKTGVLLRAGLLLNLSPSSSSRNFSRIRSYFPQEIFRQMEGIWVPTNYYLQIKPQIHQILEASEAMMDMQFDPSQSTRTFVLSSVMTEISVVISGVLPKMIERAPKVRLDLSKHDNEIAAVSEGKADFAVITDVDLAPDLHRMKLYPLDRVLLVRKGHPLTQLKGSLLTRYLQVYDRVS